MRKGQTSGQVNLLTGKTEVDLVVYVSLVETVETHGRDAVTITSKDNEDRYATFVLRRWNGDKPVLRESVDWLTYGESSQATKIAYDLFIKGREEGRFT